MADDIRDYFGDHVAVYFAWMGMYTRALVFPSALGIASMVLQVTADGGVDDNPTTMAYSIFFAAWSITFLMSWRRHENELAFLWGTLGFEGKEKPRPEFVGLHVINPETKSDEVVYNNSIDGLLLRYGRLTVSLCISCCFIYFTIQSALWATTLKDSRKELSGYCCGYADADPFDTASCCGCWRLEADTNQARITPDHNPGEEGCPASLQMTFGVGNETSTMTTGCANSMLSSEAMCLAAANSDATTAGGFWFATPLVKRCAARGACGWGSANGMPILPTGVWRIQVRVDGNFCRAQSGHHSRVRHGLRIYGSKTDRLGKPSNAH
jgi:hypothetical protein